VFCDPGEEPFGARAVGLGQDDGELIAAESRRRIGRAAGLPDGVGHADERARTHAVSASVVDSLQAVDVDDKNRERALRPVRSRDLAAHDGQQAAIVAEAREDVGLREIREARLGAGPIGREPRDDEAHERHGAKIGCQAQERLERCAPDEGTDAESGRD
jgi:hypothetical protein